MSCGLVGVANLFLFCYFGKLATQSFAGMSNALYESNWPEIPVRLQKYFIISIANTQKHIYYHGFGVAVLNLETFTNVRLLDLLLSKKKKITFSYEICFTVF